MRVCVREKEREREMNSEKDRQTYMRVHFEVTHPVKMKE